MSVVVRDCRPDELPTVAVRLDGEFVFGKQRSLSLRKRFPNALSPENLQQVRVAVSEEGLCGALAIRLFDWVAGENTWRGAMVGMVWVDPILRGRGIGRLLMTSAAQSLRDAGVDLGVLWTGTHAFYGRAGWFLCDRGLLGESVARPLPPPDGAVSCRDLACIEPAWLEQVRSRFLPQRVARRPLDYGTVPIPARKVFCFLARSNGDGEGFALVGDENGTGYFYEMAAPAVLWDVLWRAIAGRFGRLVVNGLLGDPLSQWLGDQGYVAWCPQSKAMWLRVSSRADDAPLDAWHIPYFDRI
jgi:predicted N-acetyltransferase YhbS